MDTPRKPCRANGSAAASRICRRRDPAGADSGAAGERMGDMVDGPCYQVLTSRASAPPAREGVVAGGNQRPPTLAELAAELRERLARVREGGSAPARERHVARGKLLARQRVDRLLDPGSPFLELSPLAATGMYGDEVPAAGIVTGVGRVAGRECVVVANDATVKGGTYYPVTVKKHLRAQQVAAENR